MPRSLRPLLIVCTLALLAPAAAHAGVLPATMIDGSPLNVWTDPRGSVQASVDGYSVGEWYPPQSFDANGNPMPNGSPNAGVGLLVAPGGRNLAPGSSSPRFPSPR